MRLLYFLEQYFGVFLMGFLILEGVLAFCLIFIFPPASILLVFLGVMTLALSIAAKALLRYTIRFLCHLLEQEPPVFED